MLESMAAIFRRQRVSESESCSVVLCSSYPFNGLVTTWRRPPHFQVCVIGRGRELNPCIPLSVLSMARVMIAQWENECFSLSVLPLSYHDPAHKEDRQRDTFILPLSYHDPSRREDRQWDTFILPLSYHDPGHREARQRDTFILPLRGQAVRNIHPFTELSWLWWWFCFSYGSYEYCEV